MAIDHMPDPPADAIDIILRRAEQHGDEVSADHEIGDLQQLFREAWGFLNESQRKHVYYASKGLWDEDEG